MRSEAESNNQESLDRLTEENSFLRSALEKTDQGKELIRQREEFSLLLAVSKLIVSELNLDAVFLLVASRARDLVQADLVLVPMLDEGRDRYTYKAASGVDAEAVLEASFPVTVGMCGWVLQNERSLLFGETSPCWLDEMTCWEKGQQSAVLVPLFGRKRIIGGLSALGKKGGGSFSTHDLDLLTMFANQVSTAIENAVLFHQVQSEVEERRQAEIALRESERSYKTLVQTIPDLIWLKDADGVFLSCNHMFERLYGASEAAIIGKTDNDFVSRELAESFREHDRRAMAAGKPSSNEEWLTFADNGYRGLFDTIKTPMFDAGGALIGVLGIARDITERKRAEEALRASEERYRTILQTAIDGFWRVNTKGRLLEVNETYCRMSGYSEQEILAMSIPDLEAAEAVYDIAARIQKIMAQGEDRFESRHRRKDGSIFDVEVSVQYRPAEGGYLVAFLRDITGRKLAGEEKYKLEVQLQQAQKMETVGRLAGGVAHDFNNILTAIIGYGNITLMKMATDDPNRQYIEQMLEASDRAVHLTRDLLLFSRKQPPDRKPVDLNEGIQKLGKFLVRVIGEDIAFKTLLSGGTIPVLADENQIGQVLMNLATNARDAMPKGGTFTISTEQVHLDEEFTTTRGLGMSGRYAQISVSDTGHGMDEATSRRIFDPFFTTKEVGKGTGLGLAVVYGIVKQHDGHITVYSEPGTGTTFRIYLPVITVEASGEKEKVSEEHPVGGTEIILLAEDNEVVRKLTVAVLEDFGYTVITAVDGEDAVARYREHGDSIQLLLFDLIMPKKNGKEAYDEIRKIRPDLKIIFSSGYSADIVRDKASIGSEVSIIFKPVSPVELLKKVRSVLDKDSI